MVPGGEVVLPFSLASDSDIPQAPVNVRTRPSISDGTVKTDTGQIIRSFEGMRVYETAPKAADPAVWALGRELGFNTARVAVKTVSIGRTVAQQLDLIDQVVEAARNNRCYVMLMYADDAPGAYQDNIPANRDKAIAFWSEAAPRYKDEPHVFYEMINEPDRKGAVAIYIGSAPNNTPTALLTSIRAIFNVMRSGAPDTIIAVPSDINIESATGAARYVAVIQAFEALGSSVDWTKTAWSYHHYNQTHILGVNDNLATDGGAAGLAYIKARYPLLMTEWNYWIEDARIVLQYDMRIYEQLQIGYAILSNPTSVPSYLAPVLDDLRSVGYNIPVE